MGHHIRHSACVPCDVGDGCRSHSSPLCCIVNPLSSPYENFGPVACAHASYPPNRWGVVHFPLHSGFLPYRGRVFTLAHWHVEPHPRSEFVMVPPGIYVRHNSARRTNLSFGREHRLRLWCLEDLAGLILPSIWRGPSGVLSSLHACATSLTVSVMTQKSAGLPFQPLCRVHGRTNITCSPRAEGIP